MDNLNQIDVSDILSSIHKNKEVSFSYVLEKVKKIGKNENIQDHSMHANDIQVTGCDSNTSRLYDTLKALQEDVQVQNVAKYTVGTAKSIRMIQENLFQNAAAAVNEVRAIKARGYQHVFIS